MMNKAFQMALAAVIVTVAATWGSALTSTVSAQGAAPAASAGGDYKIGVVDMDNVVKQYTKLKSEADTLQAQRDKLQKDLDARTETLQKKMEDAKNAPEAEREKKRDEVESELRKLKADFTSMQSELDSAGQKLRARTRQEIIKAIQQIGLDEKYHLILEADTEGRSTVIYFASPIDITSKVVAKLNGQAGAAPAAAPAAAGGKK